MPKNGRVETSLKANKKARKVYHKCTPPGDLTGLIKWGDGKLEEYADGSSHTYTIRPYRGGGNEWCGRSGLFKF